MRDIELTEQILSTINSGKTASIVYSHMHPVLQALKDSAITSLMQSYRTGKFCAQDAQSKIAQLVILEDLETRLKTQINKGEMAFKKTQGD